jgi:hypothetical protein
MSIPRELQRLNKEYQVDGRHYAEHKIQPWDIIEEYGLDFFEGNALKYLLRHKPGVPRAVDLEKALHYLEKCLHRERNKDLT